MVIVVCGWSNCLHVCRRLHPTQSPRCAVASRAPMQVFYAADLGEQLSAFSGITLLKQALWLRDALQIVSARHGHQPVVLLGKDSMRMQPPHVCALSNTIAFQIQLSVYSLPPFPRHFSVERVQRVTVPQATPWAACSPPSSPPSPRPLPPILPHPST